MKNVAKIIGAVVLIAFMASCGSAPAPKPEKEPTKPVVVKPVKPQPIIVNHKNYLFGKEPPNWVTMTIQELEGSAEFKDFYVYVGEATGKSQQGAELVAKNFSGLAAFTTYMNQRVQNIFVGAQAGDQDKVETYMENVVKTMSDATFSGFRQVENYWVEYQYPDQSETTFMVKILFTIEKAQVKKLLNAELDKQAEDTPEKKTTKDTVRKLIEGNLPALEQ